MATTGDASAVEHAELAYAAGAGSPVTWLSLRASRLPVALVAAVPADAQVDAGLDAWLSALEATASPNVRPPEGASACVGRNDYAHVAWPRSRGAAPLELTLERPDDVMAALSERGLVLASDLPPANRYVVWAWVDGDGAETTRTLRVVGGERPLPLAPGLACPLSVDALTGGATSLAGELPSAALAVTYVVGERPTSDYRARLGDWIAAAGAPLVEMRSRGSLFDWGIYDAAISLPPFVNRYAEQAREELPALDAEACARELRTSAADGSSASSCGEARDASLALGAVGAELTTLQRFALSAESGFDPERASPGGSARDPLIRAKRLDDSACAPPQLGSSPSTPSAATSGRDRSTTTEVDAQSSVVVEETEQAEVEPGCGSSPTYQQDDGFQHDDSGCSSDTSESQSSSDDSGCSSDTSESQSSSDDSGCSSDTSESQSSSDDSGYSGDTCTSGAAPGAEHKERSQAQLSIGQRRPARRLHTSLWSVAGVALGLPIRRRNRGVRGAR